MQILKEYQGLEEDTVTLRKLQAVKYLLANEEQIESLEGIRYLPNLIELNLEGNYISSLSEEITTLKSLDKLILSRNKLTEIRNSSVTY